MDPILCHGKRPQIDSSAIALLTSSHLNSAGRTPEERIKITALWHFHPPPFHGDTFRSEQSSLLLGRLTTGWKYDAPAGPDDTVPR
jgi:hypothetical protein